jgi:hypothetical protein
MRGDSIRDLYAKTLALVGLGVLAGTGALVDYWPSGVQLPAVESVLPRAEIARSLPVARFDRPAVRPVAVAQVRSSRTAPRAVAPIAEDTASGTPEPSLVPADVLASASELEQRPVARFIPISFSADEDEALHGEEVSLSDPAFFRPTSTLALSAPAVVLSDDDSDGRITGVVKRTGTTLVRGSRKTGASIWEMVRVVGGAVRKALPN